MNLLQEDLRGINGENWQKSAKTFVNDDIPYLFNYIRINENFVPVWVISNKPVPKGILYAMEEIGYRFDMKAAKRQRSIYVDGIKKHLKSNLICDLSSEYPHRLRFAFGMVIKMIKAYFSGELYIDKVNVARWKTNNNVIPSDCYECLAYSGVLSRLYFVRNNKVRAEELEQSLSEYRERMKNHKPSDEELYEMRAAFGTGKTVVDVFTGKEYKT